MDKGRRLKSLLEDMRSGVIAHDKLFDVIHEFGEKGFLEAKPEVEALLVHPDPGLRYIALSVLTFHWMCQEHRATCGHFIVADEDEDNRRLGVAGLGALLQGTRDRDALKMLLTLFRDEAKDWDIRDTAYRSILYVLGRPPAEQPPATRKLDHNRDVNWDRIREAEEIAGCPSVGR